MSAEADRCQMCTMVAVQGPLFIADLDVTRVYLNEDQFFPGWTYVVLRAHATELWELDAPTRAQLIEDVTRTARALEQVFRPVVKMNYELLGNQMPHIHWHLVPRLPGDPDPRWPVWRVEHERRPLGFVQQATRVEAIRRALAGR